LTPLENTSGEGTGLDFGKTLEDELAIDRFFRVAYQGNRLQCFGPVAVLQKGVRCIVAMSSIMVIGQALEMAGKVLDPLEPLLFATAVQPRVFRQQGGSCPADGGHQLRLPGWVRRLQVYVQFCIKPHAAVGGIRGANSEKPVVREEQF